MKTFQTGLLWALLFLPQLSPAQGARKGLIDLQKIDLKDRAPIRLVGEWEFYMSQLVFPDELKGKKPTPEYVDFPSTWNDLNKRPDPGSGYATWRLRIVVRPEQPLALELPHFYSSYLLWINGNIIASNGEVGTSREGMKPQWLPQIVDIEGDRDTLDLVLQVSNYHHALGGVREDVLLGNSDNLHFKRKVATISYVVMCGFLVLISIVVFFIYLLSNQDASLLYLAALSLTWGLRSMFSNLYMANFFIPEIPWELCVKIEYLTLYLSMIWAMLFIGRLFRNEVNIMFQYLFCICNGMFVIITLFFDAIIYTRFLPVYLSFAAVLLIYTIYVLIRAIVYERDSVWLMVSFLFLAVILFSYDLISYERLASYNPIIVSTGYLTIFVLMSLALLYKLGLLKRSTSKRNVLTYEDLYGPTKGK